MSCTYLRIHKRQLFHECSIPVKTWNKCEIRIEIIPRNKSFKLEKKLKGNTLEPPFIKCIHFSKYSCFCHDGLYYAAIKKKKAYNPSYLWLKTAKVYLSPTYNPLWVQMTLQGSSFSAQAQPCRLLLISQNLLISTFPRKDKTGAFSISNQMI